MLNRRKKSGLNLKIKVGSFIFALLLWLFVVINNTYNYNVEVPIDIENLKQGKIIAREIPEKIVVNFHGKGIYLLAMKYLKSSNARFRLDLSTINRFWNCPVSDYLSWIILPRGLRGEIQVREVVSPDTIRIVLDDKAEKQVPVDCSDISIQPKTGYVLVGPPDAIPDSVTVSGPERIVSHISAVSVKPYKFDNKSNDFSAEIELKKPESELVTLKEEKIRLFAEIQKLGEKVIDNVEVKVKNVPVGIEVIVEPSVINLKIIGGVTIIGEIDYEHIEVYVNYPQELRESNSTLVRVNVEVPEKITSYEPTPPEVRLSVK